jgi:uncharacterized protein (TIGR00297 family)
VGEIVRVASGGLLSAAVAFAAHRRAALTISGAWAAAIMGTVLATAGWKWLALVGVFFITSSILTRLDAKGPGRASRDRAGRRWQQVIANGGIASLAAAVYAITGWPQAFGAAAGAIAAATADTWATEAGRWSRTLPRLVTTGQPVAPGASGGVTIAGTLASVAGAVLIAAVALALDGTPRGAAPTLGARLVWATWIAIAGITGSLFDSVLGATVEGRWPLFDNDTVNVAATAWGAALTLYAMRAPYVGETAVVIPVLVSSTCALLRAPLDLRGR